MRAGALQANLAKIRACKEPVITMKIILIIVIIIIKLI